MIEIFVLHFGSSPGKDDTHFARGWSSGRPLASLVQSLPEISGNGRIVVRCIGMMWPTGSGARAMVVTTVAGTGFGNEPEADLGGADLKADIGGLIEVGVFVETGLVPVAEVEICSAGALLAVAVFPAVEDLDS